MRSDTGARRPVGRSALLISALLTVAGLVAPAVGAMAAAAPAGADPVATLQAKAAQVAQTLVREELQVGAYQQQYSTASAVVQHDETVIAATQQQVAADQQRINADTARVRDQAVRDYMNAGSATNDTEAALLTGGGSAAIVQHEYQNIASGNITTEIDRLNTSRQALQSQQAALQQQENNDQVEVNRQAGYLHQATTIQGQLASEQALVTGQLATAVAQQQAAQDAAAQAAVRAAEQQAAKAAANQPGPSSAPAPSGSGSPVAAPVSGGTDPALNPFLQCVVQAESGGNYGAVSPGGQYMGAFQFSQSTWNVAAQAAGRPDLVGVPPNLASKADQDTLAVTLYALDGEAPWLGDRCSA